MFDKYRLDEILVKYKEDFVASWWSEEKYKWEAIKTFQDNWDVNASDFADMLSRSLSKTENLLSSNHNFPRRMICKFAKRAPEEVREMFLALYDESVDVVERIISFKSKSQGLLEKYADNPKADHHFQKENTISTYLWLRYPDKYYIYKIGVQKEVATKLGSNYLFKSGAYEENLRNFYCLYNEICDYIRTDTELIGLLQSQLTDACYPDTALKTLTVDIGYYVSLDSLEKKAQDKFDSSNVDLYPQGDYAEEDRLEDTTDVDDFPAGKKEPNHYWWLTANPKIWSFSDMEVGKTQFYTLYNAEGNKRRIFQNFLNVKAGDMVIGYESNPVKKVVALCKITAGQDGKEIQFEKVEGLASPIDYAKLKSFPELAKMEFFTNPNGSLFSMTKEEYDFTMDVIRDENPLDSKQATEKYDKGDFLEEVFMSEERYDMLVTRLENKKNIILQGAPGVGKTFMAKRLAYSMMGEKDESRIEFVQFHQNYSYEDFMMGYKPSEDGFELRTGIFYKFCQMAANRPREEFFFIIDEINRGNMSKIFGELLMSIENDYRGEKIKLAYDERPFSVPENLYIIGMMNTADRSLAMIDYALRRRFSFFEMQPNFDSEGFVRYQDRLNNDTFNRLIERVKELNTEITNDGSLGKGFCIGHSYFCNWQECTEEQMRAVIDFDILPMLEEYWFDDGEKLERWRNKLHEVIQ